MEVRELVYEQPAGAQFKHLSTWEHYTPGINSLWQSAEAKTGNNTLSVVVRCHQEARLPFLEEAVFSLAIQDWTDLETVVVLQNATGPMKEAVETIFRQQPWLSPPRYKIIAVDIPQGVDGRTCLLNEGIRQTSGRYLAFLDDDDVVYQHAYTTLIRGLILGEGTVAVGGCRRAQIRYESNHWFVENKDNYFAWGRTRLDLFRENFVPIHSYVIDRSRLGDFDLMFDDSFPVLEDYEFLLRLSTAFDPDFSNLDTPVCEYRIRLDGSNSIAHTPNAPADVIAVQRRSQKLLREKKEALMLGLPPSDLHELKERLVASILVNSGGRTMGESLPGSDNQGCDKRVRPGDENRVLAKIVQEMYLFFSRHPQWEQALSHLLHKGWRGYRRLKRVSDTEASEKARLRTPD